MIPARPSWVSWENTGIARPPVIETDGVNSWSQLPGYGTESIASSGDIRKIMKVVILCGGQGTRLREETEFRPKPLVLVGDRPVVWHIMKLFSNAGLREFVLCLGYRGNMIKEYFLNYEAMTNDFTI